MCYADDTLLYISFPPLTQTSAFMKMNCCFRDLMRWMQLNKMKLNPDKTTAILIGSRQQLLKCSVSHIELGKVIIPLSKELRNLGMQLDVNMSMNKHIDSVCKAAHFHLRQLGRIRRFLKPQVAIAVAHAFVTSRIDYGNSLFWNIPLKQIKRLQRVLNTAARIVLLKRKTESATCLLKTLHWLPVKQRVSFKIALLTYKSLMVESPQYLQELLTVNIPVRDLRSSKSLCLSVPRCNTETGTRAFHHAGPSMWNALPDSIKELRTTSSFKKNLKTFLFETAFVNE
jgi:hypothetical protein